MGFRIFGVLVAFVGSLLYSPAVYAENNTLSFTSDNIQLTAPVNLPYQLNLLTLLSGTGNGNLTWDVTQGLPSWLTLDSANQQLTGNPTQANLGPNSFVLFVTDGTDQGASSQITITVNAIPVWNPTNINLGVQFVGTPWTFNLATDVVDPLNGQLQFSATGLPSWMTISQAGVLSGTPPASSVGLYKNIVITATGAGGASQATAFGWVLPAGAGLALSGPTTIESESCSKVTVNLQDGSGNALVAQNNVNVSLSSTGIAVSAYASTACSGTPVTQVVIPQGQSSLDFYVLAQTQGQFTLQASSAPLTSSSLTVTVQAPGIPQIVLSVTPANQSFIVGSCVSVTASFQDSSGNALIPPANVTLALSSNSPDLQFASDTACQDTVNQLTVPAGQGSIVFQVTATVAQAAKTILAASSGYTTGSATLGFTPGAADHLVVTSGAATYLTQQCGVLTATLVDKYGNQTTTNQALSFVLSASGAASAGALLYTDGACGVQGTNTTLAQGASSLPLSFQASAPGSVTFLVTPSLGLTPGSATVNIIQPANLVAVPSAIAFGNVLINTTSNLSVTVTNQGGSGAISSVALVGDSFTLLGSSTCQNNLTLAAGASCDLNVTFAPTAAGPASGTLTLSYGTGTLILPVSGIGTLASKISFQGVSDLSFGQVLVNATKTLSVTLINNGGSGKIQSFQISGPPYSVLPTSTCAANMTLAAGASCVFNVQFAPTTANSAWPGTLVIQTDNGALTSNLSGSSVLPSNFSFAGVGNLNFGTILTNTTATLSITLQNTGGNGNLVTLSAPAAPFVTLPSSTCQSGLAMAAGATCVVNVEFEPTAAGSYSSTINFTTDGGNLSSSLTGVAITPGALAFSPAQGLALGSIAVGQSNSGCVTVTNIGQAPVTLSALSLALGMNFSLASSAASCGATTCTVGTALAWQGSCFVDVQFSPLSAGALSDTLNVSGTMMGQNLAYPYGVSGTGVVAPPPPPPPTAPTASILVNGVTALDVASDAAVTVSWTSQNATQCSVNGNDLSATYPVSIAGGTKAGTYQGAIWQGTSNPGIAITPSTSLDAWRNMTYTLTCTGSGGTVSASASARRYAWAAGGPTQVSYILGSQAEAQSCAKIILAGKAANPTCDVGRWGTLWADGTMNPWWLKPANAPGGGKWCSCFNPSTAPAGKPWAVQNGEPQ
jgi:Putative Ig domain/Abnormal spindle-like microcephaly-assoc'd, ASPM-SPD-2-Hydin